MFGIWYVCIWVSPFSLLIVRDKLHFHHEAVLRTKEIKMPNIISFCLFCFQDLIKMWSDEIRVASHIEAKAHEEDDHEDGAADSFCPLFPFLIMKHNCVHFWRFRIWYMSHSQMLGKVESGGGPIFKVVLEC